MGYPIRTYRSRLEREKGKEQALEESITDKNKELVQSQRELKNIEDSIPIVQLVAQQTQDELKYKISELVSLALAAVFKDPYEFDLTFDIKRGKTEAVLSFIRDGNKIDPMTATGGGAVDVAAFALRIALWNLKNPKSNNTIILDEPGRFISRDLQPKFGKMIQEISRKLGIQFIIVTHNDAIVDSANRIFTVEMKKKQSVISFYDNGEEE